MKLTAIDPAKTKPSWGAEFIDGKFSRFVRIDYRKIINQEHPLKSCDTRPDNDKICLIERPYVNAEHSPRAAISMALACGEISFYMRLYGFKIVEVDSWGTPGGKHPGWIQSHYGRVTRAGAIRLAMQEAKNDGIEVCGDDQAMAYGLGKWWLRRVRRGLVPGNY